MCYTPHLDALLALAHGTGLGPTLLSCQLCGLVEIWCSRFRNTCGGVLAKTLVLWGLIFGSIQRRLGGPSPFLIWPSNFSLGALGVCVCSSSPSTFPSLGSMQGLRRLHPSERTFSQNGRGSAGQQEWPWFVHEESDKNCQRRLFPSRLRLGFSGSVLCTYPPACQSLSLSPPKIFFSVP